jgi:hypothetical protein
LKKFPRHGKMLDKPNRCKKFCGHFTPTLPSPLRGGGLEWGAKVTNGEDLLSSRKSISAARMKGYKKYPRTFFGDNRIKLNTGFDQIKDRLGKL